MKAVVGLGNPGDKYSNSRHNVGFIILDKIVELKDLEWDLDSNLKAEVCRYKTKVFETFYAKPQTFMNISGKSVARILTFYKITPEDLTVIHDDIDLPFGQIKKQFGAGSAGHNGVQSIIASIGTKEFTRVRVGIGRPDNINTAIEDWVLMPLSLSEISALGSLSQNIDSSI